MNRLRRMLRSFLGNKYSLVRDQGAEYDLHETEQCFRQLGENIQEVFWLLNADASQTLYLSPSFEALWDRPARSMLASPSFLLQTIHPEDLSRIQRVLDEQGWSGLNHDYRIQLCDGTIRWIHTRCFVLPDEHSDSQRIAGVSVDISKQKRLEREKDMMTRALEQSADTVMITDADGVIVYVNAAFEDISGYAKDEVLGLRPSLLRSGFQDESFYQRVWQSLGAGLPFIDVFINRRKDGELFYEAKSITPLRGKEGDITHFVSTGKDITERLKGRERLQRLLHYDTVTGLASRVLLHDRLHQAILHARRLHTRLGVVCLGLGLSELLGKDSARELHEQMMRAAAERLQGIFDSDCTLARLAEDEFVVLLKNIEQDEELEETVNRLLVAFAEPLRTAGYELFVTPAVGISISPEHSEEPDELLRRALMAMLHARRDVQRDHCYYRTDMHKGSLHSHS